MQIGQEAWRVFTQKQSNHSYLTSPSEVISTMSDKIEFSPAIPWPEPFDVQKRIQALHGYLDPKNPQYEREQQHVNIRDAIQLYRDGKFDWSENICIMEGKVVTRQEMFKGTAWLGSRCAPLDPSLRTYLMNGFNYRKCVISLLNSLPTVIGLWVSTFTK